MLSIAGIYLIKDIFRQRNVVNKMLSTPHVHAPYHLSSIQIEANHQMKPSTFSLVTASLIISGLAIHILSALFDPFAIPFPDWHDIPVEQQQLYIQSSKICSLFKYLGVACLASGISGLIYRYVKKKKQVD